MVERDRPHSRRVLAPWVHGSSSPRDERERRSLASERGRFAAERVFRNSRGIGVGREPNVGRFPSLVSTETLHAPGPPPRALRHPTALVRERDHASVAIPFRFRDSKTEPSPSLLGPPGFLLFADFEIVPNTSLLDPKPVVRFARRKDPSGWETRARGVDPEPWRRSLRKDLPSFRPPVPTLCPLVRCLGSSISSTFLFLLLSSRTTIETRRGSRAIETWPSNDFLLRRLLARAVGKSQEVGIREVWRPWPSGCRSPRRCRWKTW